MIDDKTGYLALTQFTINTPEDVMEALEKLKSLGMKQLIFDLRGNTGGSLDAAVSIVKFFITNGTIVYTRGSAISTTKHGSQTVQISGLY